MWPLLLALSMGMPPDDPSDLVARLVSGEPSAREEAAGRLEEIGRPALPALRAAMGDPAGSPRVADLIDLIEGRRVLRATPVAFEVKDVPLADALAEFGRLTGTRPVLDPGEAETWRTRRVTSSTGGPLPFWAAIDRLGEAGGFRVDAGSSWFGVPSTAEPTLRLVRRVGPPARSSIVGPYRVDLVGLNRHRSAAQARPGRPPKVVSHAHHRGPLAPGTARAHGRNDRANRLRAWTWNSRH